MLIHRRSRDESKDKKMKKQPTSPFILFFLFILAINLVEAVPPVQTVINEINYLEILYPITNTFKEGNPGELHFHIFNSSLKILDEAKLNCSIHIYNSTNNHVIRDVLQYDGKYDWSAKNLYTNKSGIYSYNLWCNSTQNEFGLLSSYYYVTKTGDPPNDLENMFELILGMLGITGLLLYIAFNTPVPDEPGYTGVFTLSIKLTTFGLSLFLIYSIFSLIINNSYITLANDRIINVLESDITAYTFFMWFILSLLMLFFFVKSFNTLKGWMKIK